MKRSKKIYDHREVLNDNVEKKASNCFAVAGTMGKFVASRITQLNVKEKNQENVFIVAARRAA